MNHKPMILIIDDTPGNLMLLGKSLEEEFDLRVATSGSAGLQLAAELSPELILLDVMMPDMDGFEVCRRLKANDLLKGIPVIFVTAMTEMEAEVSGLQVGAADYITKPINVGIARQRIRNLVERERLRQAAEQNALQVAATLTQLKRDFLLNISHELRTPLNVIIGLAMMGRRSNDLDKARQNFGHIHAAGNDLLGLVENVLAFADAEAGRTTLEPAPFPLGSLLGELGSNWARRAGEKGVRFTTQGIDTVQAECIGDARRVEIMVDQLLSNAVKFTDQGEVRLDVARDVHNVSFTVSDSGVGMSEAELLVAFRPFEQAHGGLTRRFGGIGLALALVKHLADLMGGSLHAESTPGRGTRFEMVLPLPLAAAPTA